ncbi:MAG: outer membrane lipoprotein LolB [Gammaproteobacteria bacterium]|nr:outer membrane lipoprotein LolB [Gammaproteobacteria bacterium]
MQPTRTGLPLHRLFALLLPLFLNAGCALAPPPPPSATTLASFTPEQEYLLRLRHWSINGRLAVKHRGEGMMATLIWNQDGEDYQIDLHAPSGGHSLRLLGTEQGVTLTTNEGEVITASTPESLLYHHFGLQIPISSIYYWIRGIPAPGRSHQSLDDAGNLLRLEQGDWTVAIPKYHNEPFAQGSIPLPQSLTIEGEESRLRIAIHRWSKLAFSPLSPT